MQTDIDIVSDYLNGEILRNLSKKNNTTDSKIKQRLRQLGYEYVHADHRSSGRNYDAFKDINEEAFAYFYGFILGDGCLTKKDNIVITLKESDKEILLGLKNYLNHPNEIRTKEIIKNKITNTKGKYCSFSFSDVQIIEKFKELGLMPAKSCREVIPDCFKYNRHFWRGLIDADGCLFINRKKKVKNAGISLVSSEQSTLAFKEFCKSLNIDNVTLSNHSVSKSAKYATLTGQSARKVCMYLYNDCKYFLSRKLILATTMYVDFWEVLLKNSTAEPRLENNGTWTAQVSDYSKTLRSSGHLSREDACIAITNLNRNINNVRLEENSIWAAWSHTNSLILLE